MHESVEKWLKKYTDDIAMEDRRAYDFGAYDINGSARTLLPDWDVVGIDWRDGPGVHVVSLAHQFEGEPRPVVISTEMLEHDPFVSRSVQTMWKHVSNPGILIITCASNRRPPHDTECSPAHGYYLNVKLIKVVSHLTSAVRLVWEQDEIDLRVAAWKGTP